MKAALYFLIILPVSIFANGNDDDFGVIKGMVSTSDGHPAAYVTLLLKNTGQGGTTDEKGNFEIKKIKPGQYILHVSLLGYSDTNLAVEVKPDETVFLNIQLQGTYAELKKVIVEGSVS